MKTKHSLKNEDEIKHVRDSQSYNSLNAHRIETERDGIQSALVNTHHPKITACVYKHVASSCWCAQLCCSFGTPLESTLLTRRSKIHNIPHDVHANYICSRCAIVLQMIHYLLYLMRWSLLHIYDLLTLHCGRSKPYYQHKMMHRVLRFHNITGTFLVMATCDAKGLYILSAEINTHRF